MRNTKIKVSVLIPVYNVEKYLSKCIDSIINQTLKEIEIICIDDGSTDSSGKILDDYALKDNRVKVIYKTNGGYGKALNIGIENANGSYIGIIDSDDWIEPEMYETLYYKAKEYDLDFVKSDYRLIWEEYNYIIERRRFNNSNNYNRVIKNNEFNLCLYAVGHWTGIYKRSFLIEENIRFNESPGASFQDTGFWLQTSFFYKKAMFLDRLFYNYRQDNPGSSAKNKEKMLAYYYEYDFVENAIIKRNCKREVFSYYVWLRLCVHLINLKRVDDSLKYDFCQYIIKDYFLKKDEIDLSIDEHYHEIVSTIEQICKNPLRFCEDMILKKKTIYKKLNENNKLIIYGAGIRSRYVIGLLINNNYYEKIQYIVVSEKKYEDQFCDIKILSLSEINDLDNSLVLIAVKKESKSYNEIIQNLESIGVKNYIDTEGLMLLN